MSPEPSALPVRADRSNHPPTQTAETLVASLDAQAEDSALLETLCRAYQACLAETPEARTFFTERHLTRDGLLERFEVGYADRRLARSLPGLQTQAGQAIRQRLQRLGLYRRSGHNHYNGCLVFPIRAADGSIAELYGRKRGKHLTAGTELHLYRCLPEPRGDEPADDLPLGDPPVAQALFGQATWQPGQPLVLADSVLNALSFDSAGIESVSCTLRAGLAPALIAALLQLGPSPLLLAYRNTEAGVKAAETAEQTLTARGLPVARILLPAGQDANDVLRAEGADRLRILADAARHRSQAEDSAPVPRNVTTERRHPREQEREREQEQEPHDESPPGDITLHFDDRHWRVRGLTENTSPMRLKVNLKVTRDRLFHLHLLDLYSAVARRGFIREAASELYVPESLIKQDLGHVLARLETEQETMLRQTFLLGARSAPENDPKPMTEAEHAEAMALLTDPRLTDRISDDLDRCGMVGEEANRLLCYLACTSRLLDRPLSILIQSSSAAGKTTLMDAALRLMPPEVQHRYSAMTGQSLYYLGRGDLKHKILAIAEEEGVAEASYALKLLQSEGRLRIATAEKDQRTGRQRTGAYTVEGPVAMLLTTTSHTPDEELAGRCLVLHVNESPEQTEAIHRRQRQAFSWKAHDGVDARRIIATHHHAQRLLEPQRVIIPGAETLTFRTEEPRMRRDHAKYLSLIATITLLHQHQRNKQVLSGDASALLATTGDVHLADRLLRTCLGPSADGLLPRTRHLLDLIGAHVTHRAEREQIAREQVRLTQRELREAFGWGDFALRKHLARLVALELLLVYRTGRGNERHYQLMDDGQTDKTLRPLGG